VFIGIGTILRETVVRAIAHQVVDMGKHLLALLTLIAIQVMSGCGGPLPEPPEALERHIAGIVDRLIPQHFPELEPITIHYAAATQNTDSVFLETDVGTKTIFRASADRQYVMYLNRRLLEHPPGNAALEAILVHELCHIRDFTEMSGWGLIRLYLNVNYDAEFEIRYERETDLCALRLGYGEGLKAYRQWLYRIIADPETVAMKRNVYFTPGQIDEWLLAR